MRAVSSSIRSLRSITSTNVAIRPLVSAISAAPAVSGVMARRAAIPTSGSIASSTTLPLHNASLVAPSRSFAAAAAARPFAGVEKRAENVGIHAMDVYFPSQYVDQNDLEVADGVGKGKYTKGLGQQGLAFVNDREDIYSICLSAVSRFMMKHNIPYTSIGRLEVATETMLDHSKSIKTVLMQLFQSSGNTDIEGVDTYNACYGGTAALFNSAAWTESSAWDGRYALVVTADIAEYAAGNARPTGGCGAVVMLVGPGAPLVLEPGMRASHMEHAYDFYKPNMTSPYPVVDGQYSNTCYIRALDLCYNRLADRVKSKTGKDFDVNQMDYVLFHAPYNKLTQKAFARLMYNDFVRNPNRPIFAENKAIQQFKGLAPETTYENRALEKEFLALTTQSYADKVGPSTFLPQHIGNSYSASLYAGLMSLVHSHHTTLPGKRALLFSYGSGLASSAFTMRIPDTKEARDQLKAVATAADLKSRLAARTKASPQFFNETMAAREKLHQLEGAWVPSSPITGLEPGTRYLAKRDEKGRRFYEVA